MWHKCGASDQDLIKLYGCDQIKKLFKGFRWPKIVQRSQGLKFCRLDCHVILYILIVADLNYETETLGFHMFHWWLLALASRKKEGLRKCSLYRISYLVSFFTFLFIPRVGYKSPSL